MYSWFYESKYNQVILEVIMRAHVNLWGVPAPFAPVLFMPL